MYRTSTIGILCAFAAASACFAQALDIKWSTIDGGGGTSVGGPFTLSGTIGQPDAGPTMQSGTFTLTGGFWASPTLGVDPCPADFNKDSFVDDTDFVTFAACYDEFFVTPPCTIADFNADGFVDDTDFVTFAAAYDLFFCP